MTGARRSVEPSPDVTATDTAPSWAVLAAVLLAAGVLMRTGTLQLYALALVVVATWLMWRSATAARPAPISLRTGYVVVLTTNALFWGLWALRASRSSIDSVPQGVVAVLAVVGLLALGWLAGRGAASRSPWPLLTLAAAAGATLTVPFSTSIDVLMFQEVSAARLLAGTEPYGGAFPHDYPPAAVEAFYAPGIADDGLLRFGFPYLPLSLLLVLPAHLLGDVRWAHLLAVLVTGWLLLRLAEDRPWARLAAIAFVTSPYPHEVVARAWTEPFIGAGIVVLLALASRRGRLSGVALGAVIALKQYVVLLAPTLALAELEASARQRLRTLGVAGVVVAATVLPFLLWNPDGFLWSVVELQFVQPYRPDSLSLLAAAVEHLGWPPAWTFRYLPFLAAGGVALVAWRRGDRGPRAAATWTALLLLATFLVSKQAFTNYYYLAFVVVLLAAVLPAGAARVADGSDPETTEAPAA